MYNCELFSLRRNRADFIQFEAGFDYTSALLHENDIDVKFKTDLNADAGKLADALEESMKNDEIDLFVFVNALNTSDSSSFKKLFYEFIVRAEATLTPDPDHQGMTPKIKVFPLGDMGMGYRGYCFRLQNKMFVALPCASLAQENVTELIIKGVNKAREVIDSNAAIFPLGIVYPEDADNAVSVGNSRMIDDKKKKPKKKEGFIRSFIPHKGDTTGTVIRKIVVLLAIAAFIGAMIYVINFFIVAPAQNNAINDEIREVAYSSENTSPTTPDGKPRSEQDWSALKKINKEIVGWIRMDDSRIDYPVMFHKGDDQNEQYYLNHTYKHEWSEYGTVFIDYRSTKSTKSKNVILHGHNMTDGSMFHELMNYSEGGEGFVGDLDYYRDHSVLTFNTPEQDAKWKIISVFKTSTLYAHGEFFNYMQGEFTSSAEFMNFVYNCRIRSMFNVPVTVNENDQLLTLSTCSYEYTNFRTVVVARKVRKGEDAKVDVKLATVNEDPFLPEVCYDGKRPDPGSFKTAYQSGKINWYDGKYNGKDDNTLKGDETLTATKAANPTEPPTEKPKPGRSAEPTEAPTSRKVFTATYTNMDGSQFAAYSVFEGDPVPVPDGHPTYDDEYYTYTFDGWNTEIPGVDLKHLNSSVVIMPKFKHELKER